MYIGIDIAKSKHDVCILDDQGKVLKDSFTIGNTKQGFELLLDTINLFRKKNENINIGLEATGHYGINLITFLLKHDLPTVELNPLQVSKLREAVTLRKTKTDQLDAKYIAKLLLTDNFKPSKQFYQNDELKSLTRYRSRVVKERSQQKIQLARLIDILFPELPTVCWSTSQKSILALLKAYPSANAIAKAPIECLENLLNKASRSKFKKAKEIQHLAQSSIGVNSPLREFELIQVINSIKFLQLQINDIDKKLKEYMTQIKSPLLTIPGISFRLAAIIHAEIGDIERFSSPSKLLAFAGLEPSTYQSGKYNANKTPMTKRGSTYLRWAIMQAARLCAIHCPDLNLYMNKKIAEGKHYFVALGHVSKKLVRIIFKLLRTGEPFVSHLA